MLSSSKADKMFSVRAVGCSFCVFSVLIVTSVRGSPQNRVKAYVGATPPFALDSLMASSLQLAAQSCESSFRWERWNCPSSDYLRRRTATAAPMDREDAYVQTITTAAILYTIAKTCSSGSRACSSDKAYTAHCSDEPIVAERLFGAHIGADFPNDLHGNARRHNHLTITSLLQRSLVKECRCTGLDAGGGCSEQTCINVLKPFEQIAHDIHRMYDQALQLSPTEATSHIMWENMPLDVLVYMKDSPNYCELDAVPQWNGMRGRQCSDDDSGEQLSGEERNRCRHLCRECGYNVRPQKVLVESRCNCKLGWDLRIQCETCQRSQRKYYCF